MVDYRTHSDSCKDLLAVNIGVKDVHKAHICGFYFQNVKPQSTSCIWLPESIDKDEHTQWHLKMGLAITWGHQKTGIWRAVWTFHQSIKSTSSTLTAIQHCLGFLQSNFQNNLWSCRIFFPNGDFKLFSFPFPFKTYVTLFIVMLPWVPVTWEKVRFINIEISILD